MGLDARKHDFIAHEQQRHRPEPVKSDHLPGFKQARLCKIQGLFKDFPTVFKD